MIPDELFPEPGAELQRVLPGHQHPRTPEHRQPEQDNLVENHLVDR